MNSNIYRIDGSANLEAAKAHFSDAHGKSNETEDATKNSNIPSFLRKAFAIGGTALALAGGLAGLEREVDGPSFSKAQMNAMAHRTVTVKPGEGVDGVILSVDQNLQAAEQTDLEQYVTQQASDGVLQPGEQVRVPIIPGHKVPLQ